MRTIGNILWFIFGGLLGGLAWISNYRDISYTTNYQVSKCHFHTRFLFQTARTPESQI